MSKWVKRVLSALLVCVLIGGAMTTNVSAYTYNADAALKYAKDNVNTSSEQCAGFVSRCLQAGGLSMTYQAGTGPCIRSICTAIGIPYQTGGNIDNNMVALVATLPTLTLDSSGYATTANSSILQAGDVVFQWCSTCPVSPHMMICNGYSGSRAVFYYTNNVGNNVAYNFKSHASHSGHTLVGKVLQIRPQQTQYTVTLNANGSIFSDDSSTSSKTIPVTNGSTYGALPETWLPYYTFDGWYTATSGGTKITETTTVNLTANQTLYARVIPNTYTFTLNANGGTVSPTSITVTFASAFGTLPTPTRTGYIFDGWYGSANEAFYGEVGGSTKITSSTILTSSTFPVILITYPAGSGPCARWVAAPNYVLTLNANGGSVSPASVTQAQGTTYTLPTPTRSGYTFTGWTLSGSGSLSGNVYTFGTSNGTVTAGWMANVTNYTLSLNANGGNVSPASVIQAQGTTYTLPTPTRSGYTFTGWTLSGGGSLNGNVYTFGTSNGTVTAGWTANVTNYTLTYNANGGTGAPTAQTMPANTDFNLSSTVPTRNGYTFLGWNTIATATTATFSPNESVYLTGNTTLYAIWQANPTNTIFSTKYEATFLNWLLFFLGFGWIWMWF